MFFTKLPPIAAGFVGYCKYWQKYKLHVVSIHNPWPQKVGKLIMVNIGGKRFFYGRNYSRLRTNW
jgi:hypothetical protein